MLPIVHRGAIAMHTIDLSRHAQMRANQRGVPNNLLDVIMAYADVDAPVGGNCTVIRISRARLLDQDVRQAAGANIDRLKSLALVWSETSGQVVTVLHEAGQAGRRYRRGH